MCIAAVIYDDLATNDLDSMEEHNPHGGGVAYLGKSGKGVRFFKGLTAKEVYDLQAKLPRPYLLHFRWATHGDKVPRLAHPFPLGPQAFTDALKGSAPAVLIHNGVWSNYELYAPRNFTKKDLALCSDTQIAAWYAAHDEAVLDDVDWSTAVGRAFDGNFLVTLRGRWMTDDRKGGSARNLYSNLSWTRPAVRSGAYRVLTDESWNEWLHAYEKRARAKSDAVAAQGRTEKERCSHPAWHIGTSMQFGNLWRCSMCNHPEYRSHTAGAPNAEGY